jgi:hypothetical protein
MKSSAHADAVSSEQRSTNLNPCSINELIPAAPALRSIAFDGWSIPLIKRHGYTRDAPPMQAPIISYFTVLQENRTLCVAVGGVATEKAPVGLTKPFGFTPFAVPKFRPPAKSAHRSKSRGWFTATL